MDSIATERIPYSVSFARLNSGGSSFSSGGEGALATVSSCSFSLPKSRKAGRSLEKNPPASDQWRLHSSVRQASLNLGRLASFDHPAAIHQNRFLAPYFQCGTVLPLGKTPSAGLKSFVNPSDCAVLRSTLQVDRACHLTIFRAASLV